MPVVIKGSNLILNRKLFRADGVTPIPVTALASYSVQLYQGDVLKGSPQLIPGADGVSLDLDLSAEITAALEGGYVKERYTIEIADDRYVDGDEIAKFDLVEVFIE